MGIVDKVMGSLGSAETRAADNKRHPAHGSSTGPEALADGQPSEVTVDDRIDGTHTRNVKDAVTHENINRHAHHEVTPVVDRQRDQVDVHQKIQPVVDEQQQHTYHQHEAPAVQRHRGEEITEEHAQKYAQQGHHEHSRQVGDQTHSTSVNAPKVHEHVNKHIVEEIQPVIERQTQQTEHHHTTQPISEHVRHAPKIHDTQVNAPIHMSEFTGGNNAIQGSHSAHPVQTGTHSGERSTGSGGLTGNLNPGNTR